MTRRLGPCLVAVGLMTVTLTPLTAQDTPTIKRVPAQSIRSVEGKDNYQEYCAVCHGKEGKGDGPAAPALKTPPADLTTIANRRQGKFPSVEVKSIIEGERDLPAHGTATCRCGAQCSAAWAQARAIERRRCASRISCNTLSPCKRNSAASSDPIAA